MKLRELILVNWGTIPDGTYRFLGTSCLVGETGAGKTSILDAMIAVMTGGSSRLGKLNSASDDGKGSRKRDAVYRTIESYLLGGSNTLFARPSAYGYVAMVFEPHDDERLLAHPVSAILAGSAVKKETMLGAGEKRSFAELGDVFYLTLEGAAASIDDFAPKRGDGKRECVAVEEIGKHLKDRYQDRKAGVSVTVHRKDQHADYLRRLYGLLEGRQEASLERARAQAEIWSKFVSQEHIDDISAFVRQFVLPAPSDFDELDKISIAVRASKRMKEQSKLVVERIECLKTARADGEAFGQKALTAKAHECAVGRKGYNDANEASRRAQLSVREAERNRGEAQARAARISKELELLREQQTGIEARLRGIASYTKSEDLTARIGQSELERASLAERIRERGRRIGALAKLCPMLEDLGSKAATHAGLVGLLAAASGSNLPTAQELLTLAKAAEGIGGDAPKPAALKSLAERARDTEERLAAMVDQLCGEGHPLRSEASAAIAVVNGALNAVRTKIQEKDDDVSRIEHKNSIRYPRLTQETVDYLAQVLPEAEPMVLCDLVIEVRTEAWQAAIEGYIGDARFGVLVKPEYEAKANLLLEAGISAGRRGGALIQGGLALKDSREAATLPADSIIHELKVENPYARAYLERQFGNVLKVRSAEDLPKVRRGVTMAGRGSGGYRTFDCASGKGDLTFGKRAREARRLARMEEIEALKKEQRTLNDELASIVRLADLEKALEALCAPSAVALCDEYRHLHGQEEELTKQLQLIDTSDADKLKGQKAQLKTSIAELDNQRQRLDQAIGGFKTTITSQSNIRAQQDGLATKCENERLDAVRDLNALAAQAPWVDAEMLLAQADAIAYDPAYSLEDVREQRNDAISKLGEMRTKFANSIGKYNASAAQDEAIPSDKVFAYEAASANLFSEVSKLVSHITELGVRLQSSQLAKLQVEIDRISDEIRGAFSTHFCNRLLKEIERGEEIVRNLNGELSHHPFGRDSFRFRGEWASESFRTRHAFFERVREKSADESFNMFAERALDKQDEAARDEILGLFLAAADEGGKAALMLIADYRQYRRYDLRKVTEVAGKEHEASISLQMTDSGGEKETGLFIARVATLTGGLGLREAGPHLKTVVIDELFKKTDEARIRSAIQYLSGTLGLHVIFAMPTRSIGPFKDLIDSEYAITRMKTDTTVGDIDHIVIMEPHVYNKEGVVSLKEAKRADVRSEAEAEFARREREETAA